MSQKLTEFLTEITTNKNLREAFSNDRAATMKKYGVSDEDAALVINHDYEAVLKKLGPGYDIAKNTIIDAFKIKK
jgi:hypothetical protein